MHSSILSMPESFPCYLNPYFIIIKTLEQNCHLFRNTLSSLCSEMNLQIFLKMKCCSFCLVARKYFRVLLKCCFQFFQHETDDMWSLEIPWHFHSVLKENTPEKSQIKIFYKSCRVLFSSCPNLFTWVCMSTWLPLSRGGWVGPISHLHIIRIGQKVHTENAHLFKKNCVCVCAHVHARVQQWNHFWQNFPWVKVRLSVQCQRQEGEEPLAWRLWYSAGKWDTHIAAAWSHIKGRNMPRPLTILGECSLAPHFQWKTFKAGRPSLFLLKIC